MGACKTCGTMDCMEHGGEVKSKKPLPKLKRTQREADEARARHMERMREEQKGGAYEGSDRAYDDYKDKDLDKYAEGGSVGDGKQRSDMEKGVHAPVGTGKANPYHPRASEGYSDAGIRARSGAKEDRNPRVQESSEGQDTGKAKDMHRKKLAEMKAMPKPKLMAHGGMADEGEPMDDDEMMNHHVMGEFMDAWDKKDKKGMLDSLRAVVMNCMGGKVK